MANWRMKLTPVREVGGLTIWEEQPAIELGTEDNMAQAPLATSPNSSIPMGAKRMVSKDSSDPWCKLCAAFSSAPKKAMDDETSGSSAQLYQASGGQEGSLSGGSIATQGGGYDRGKGKGKK